MKETIKIIIIKRTGKHIQIWAEADYLKSIKSWSREPTTTPSMVNMTQSGLSLMYKILETMRVELGMQTKDNWVFEAQENKTEAMEIIIEVMSEHKTSINQDNSISFSQLITGNHSQYMLILNKFNLLQYLQNHNNHTRHYSILLALSSNNHILHQTVPNNIWYPISNILCLH